MFERIKKCVICGKKIFYPRIKYCESCAFQVYSNHSKQSSMKRWREREDEYKMLSDKEKEHEALSFSADYLKQIQRNDDILRNIDQINDRLKKRTERYDYRTRFKFGYKVAKGNGFSKSKIGRN